MFYRVLRKLIRYIVAMFMIIQGFSCGFIVTKWSNRKNGFKNPFKSFVITLTMAMGEFSGKDIYNSFKQDEEEEIGRTFAMILIILMIFSCTITMVNLFITVVITDKEELGKAVFIENLFYMARSSEVIRDLFNCDRDKFKEKEKRPIFCVHQVCGKTCGKKKLPSLIQHMLPKLKEIVKRNINQRKRNMEQQSLEEVDERIRSAETRHPKETTKLFELIRKEMALRDQQRGIEEWTW